MQRRTTLLSVLLAALLSPAPAEAEIYRWVDETGQPHFTQDLSQVPARYRAAAEAGAAAPKGPDPVQIYTPPASATPRVPSRSRQGSVKRTHVVPVQRAGSSLVVVARLNDRVDATFLIDTGATDVVLPEHVADELGLATASARTKVYATANGTVTQRVVMLDSVSLGGARAEKVVASVSPSMDVGLLGLSFFNHFDYQVDTARGVVRLTPNDLAEEGLIRGGRGQAQWRSEYRSLRARMGRLERRIESTPDSRSRALERLEAEREQLERELELLDDEADEARVPFAWRD